jgi:hypothetical protein
MVLTSYVCLAYSVLKEAVCSSETSVNIRIYRFTSQRRVLYCGIKTRPRNETTAVARQPSANKNRGMAFLRDPLSSSWTATEELFFLCGPCLYVINRAINKSSGVQFSKWSAVIWLVSKLVRGLLRFSPCELLLWEAGSWGLVIVRETRGRGAFAVGSRYQATSGEDTADWENLLLAVVNCRVCELAIAL